MSYLLSTQLVLVKWTRIYSSGENTLEFFSFSKLLLTKFLVTCYPFGMLRGRTTNNIFSQIKNLTSVLQLKFRKSTDLHTSTQKFLKYIFLLFTLLGVRNAIPFHFVNHRKLRLFPQERAIFRIAYCQHPQTFLLLFSCVILEGIYTTWMIMFIWSKEKKKIK